MIKDRLIAAIKESGITNPELEEKTGIGRYTWQNIRNKPSREIKEEEILAFCKVFPQWRWWLLTGEVMPETGQTSPEYDEANSNLNKPVEA